MLLKTLIEKLQKDKISFKLHNINSQNVYIKGASLNSKDIKNNWAFFALPGSKTDGTHYIDEAIKNGASVIFTFKQVNYTSAPVIEIPALSRYIEHIVSYIYQINPHNFYYIGVTGTNGKTTTTYLIEHILNYCGIKCAKLGTIEYSALDYKEKSILTTPDILTLYRILAEAKKRNIKYIVMEVSSHSLTQQRINLDNFKQSIFTNLGHDHLDYHKNFDDYKNAKVKLFKYMNKNGTAIINADDENWEFFAENSNGTVITYGQNEIAQVHIYPVRLTISGSEFYLKFKDKLYLISTKLIGLYNIYNITSAFISSAHIENISPSSIIEAILNFVNPPGRLEKVNVKDYNIYIDYAHTPQALQNVLNTLNQLKNHHSRIICVFGCGGDRDRAKRPLMGKIASLLSDIVIITSDNPRTEEPQTIIEEIKCGILGRSNTVIYEEVDRKNAIKKAISLAGKDDIILIAGKGHEDYQIFKDKTIHFSDKEVVLELIG